MLFIYIDDVNISKANYQLWTVELTIARLKLYPRPTIHGLLELQNILMCSNNHLK